MLAASVQGKESALEKKARRAAWSHLSAPHRLLDGVSPINVTIGHAAPAVFDFNGDGKVWFCKGVSNGPGRPPTLLPKTCLTAGGKPIQLGYRAKLCVTDWNGDGQLDLPVGDCEDNDNEVSGYVYLMLRQP